MRSHLHPFGVETRARFQRTFFMLKSRSVNIELARGVTLIFVQIGGSSEMSGVRWTQFARRLQELPTSERNFCLVRER